MEKTHLIAAALVALVITLMATSTSAVRSSILEALKVLERLLSHHLSLIVSVGCLVIFLNFLSQFVSQ